MRRIALALFCAAVPACGGGGGAAPRPYEVGVTFSPKGFPTATTAQDYIDFYTGHPAYGEVIAFHMNWRDSVAAGGTIPASAVSAQNLGATYGFIAVVGFGWDIGGVPDLTSASEPANNTWSNAETRAEYQAMLTAYATTYRPRWIFLGNEVNTYYLGASLADWASWVSAYKACYDAIKAASPATSVFTTFQLEHLKGLGVKNGWADPPHWAILADFLPKVDAMGFTSYPYFEHETPADIPAGYYTEISTYWNGPVVFTEIGWNADPAIPYTGSEAEQAAFIPRFFTLTSSLTKGYVTQLFLHDVAGAAPSFNMIGLRTNAGVARAADAAWRLSVPP